MVKLTLKTGFFGKVRTLTELLGFHCFQKSTQHELAFPSMASSDCSFLKMIHLSFELKHTYLMLAYAETYLRLTVYDWF